MSELPVGVGTGIGSMPGVDIAEAVAVAAGECGLPFLPELPDRGVGADIIGRVGGVLVDIHLDQVHRAYRLSGRPTSVTRRARDLLRWDLDALEERWEVGGLRGDGRAVKVQLCGPWTFAAHAELRGGHKIVRDRGAVADIAASLAEGLRGLVADIERRLQVSVVVQLDEPSVGDVLDGTVTPLTRLDPIAPIPVAEVAAVLDSLLVELARPAILHSCAAPRWDLLQHLPGYAPALDFTELRVSDLDGLGQLLDDGRIMVAGTVPVTAPNPRSDRAQLVERLAAGLGTLVDRIGLPHNVLREQLLIAPTCGLAGADQRWATTALVVAREVAAAIATG